MYSFFNSPLKEINSAPEGPQVQKPRYDFKLLYQQKILDTEGKTKKVYVKGVSVMKEDGCFSYDLNLTEITPDRSYIKQDAMLDRIATLLFECKNSEVIETILKRSEANPEETFLEIQALNKHFNDKMKTPKESGKDTLHNILDNHFGDSNEFPNVLKDKPASKDHWTEAFYKLYGENAVITSGDTNANNDAVLMGYKPVKLHFRLKELLMEKGVLNASGIKVETEYRWIPEETLSAEERAVFDERNAIVKYLLGEDIPVDIKLYEGLYTKTGREIESSMGVTVTEPDGRKYVGIKRTLLGNREEFAKYLMHELGHYRTGANDFQREFADFFIRELAERYSNSTKE